TCVLRFALGEPVEAGVGGDADAGFAVLGAGAFEEDFRRNVAGAPDLGRTGHVTDRTARRGAFEQFVGKPEGGRKSFHFAQAVQPTNKIPTASTGTKITSARAKSTPVITDVATDPWRPKARTKPASAP